MLCNAAGLTDYVPHNVEGVKADIERAVRELGGEPFNARALDKLLRDYGETRCWLQAIMLRDRVLSAKREVQKITPFYMTCVRNDSPKPRTLSPSEQAKGFAVLFDAGKITKAEFPQDLRESIEDAIDFIEF